MGQSARKSVQRSSAVKEKINFGRGHGRSAGFYRQWMKKTDPECEEVREAQREECEGARTEARRAKQAAKDQQQREDAWRGTGQEQQRREEQWRAHAHQEGERRHAARKTGLDFDKMRRATWAEYDATFVAFRERALKQQSFHVSDVPLPPKGQVIESASTHEGWHQNLRSALLRCALVGLHAVLRVCVAL